MSNINKEYTYFEAMEEIIKDESKAFIGGAEHNKKLFYNRTSKRIRIADKSDNFEYSYTPVINYFWINTKWTLVEDKKSYNIRVYNVDSGKLISSEIVEMTEVEMKTYCNSKVLWMLTIPTDNNNPFVFNMSSEELNYINSKEAITRVICEEIVTT